MYHFFVKEPVRVRDTVRITGSDYNHIKNVLRMHADDTVVLTGSDGLPYYCVIRDVTTDEIILEADRAADAPELSVRITLYQGLAKGEKMDGIIQKSVELGAVRIVPVEMDRCVVRLDERKKESRTARWQAIAESAAKQSGRGIIPSVGPVMGLDEALHDAEGSLILLPYENAEGMETLAATAAELKESDNVSVFIGPEGGYEPDEVTKALRAGARLVSLGRRILRTETAGPALIAFLMLTDEINNRG